MEIAASALGAAPIGAGPFMPIQLAFSVQAVRLISYNFSHTAAPFSGAFIANRSSVQPSDSRTIKIVHGPVIGVQK